MATTYWLGYSRISNNKYAAIRYGAGYKYGIGLPPPQPTNLAIQGHSPTENPTIADSQPTFSWTLAYSTTDTLTYHIQISLDDSGFSSPTVDIYDFSAPLLTYGLPITHKLTDQGQYYCRIRSSDGFTWSDWSLTTMFYFFTEAAYPPTIDPVTSPADDFWQLITGTKGPNQYVFIRNNRGEWVEVDYPNGLAGTLWDYRMSLNNGSNLIEVIASVSGNTEAGTSAIVSTIIYLIVSIPEVFNVWNAFDEIGLLLGLDRIPGEINRKYRDRLFDVHVNPANSTESGLINGIARELGITVNNVRVERLSDLADVDYPNNLLNPDGNAIGTALENYAEEVYDNNPIFWGNVISDESYWDGVDEESSGYTYLPHQWDPTASGIYYKWLAPGIGDHNDLYVKGAEAVWNPGISGYSWYLLIHSGYFYSAYPSGFIGA